MYQILIRENHLDTFGHVNNATYLELFEEARWEIMTEKGFGLERVQRENKGPVLLEAKITYKKEIQNREKISIETNFKEMESRLTFILEQVMKKENGSIASTLTLRLGLLDFKTRKLISPPDDWIRAMGR